MTASADIDLAARELIFGPNRVRGLTVPTTAQVCRAAGSVYGGVIFDEASPRDVSRETFVKIAATVPSLKSVAVYQGSISAERNQIPSVRDEVSSLGEQRSAPQVWRVVSMTHADGPKVASSLVE